MQKRDTISNLVSALSALLADALAVFLGVRLAQWWRFHSGSFAVDPVKGVPPPEVLAQHAGLMTLAAVVVFGFLQLYRRPQMGRFEDKVPRIVRALLVTFFLYIALEAVLRINPQFSRIGLALAFPCVGLAVLLERYVIYRIEWNLARHMDKINHVLIVGTDAVARRVMEAIRREPFHRATVHGFVRVDDRAAEVPADRILGDFACIEGLITRLGVNQVILADQDLGRQRMTDLVSLCENRYVRFSLVPDLFRVLTSSVEVQDIGGVPVLGMGRWPLDSMARRLSKRLFDITGALVGLLLAGPVILLAGLVVRLTSAGPMFYRQTRCGESGRHFRIVKIRTMVADAEKAGPGWTTPDDPRRTRLGTFLRKWNIDELPQFWNVLVGDMSLVGPRPERPEYVSQFQAEFDKYMRRHNHKPGITGWAQVNGLRGDTSIQDRLKYDLYYLENWSLSLDVKILLKTFSATRNAY